MKGFWGAREEARGGDPAGRDEECRGKTSGGRRDGGLGWGVRDFVV